MGNGAPRNLMRDRTQGRERVTTVELFFDLVYVFAVTQLSHYLLRHLTAAGALQTALLLVMVWLLWAYTTWLTNWLDPDRIPVRLLLLALMLVGLAMSAALPRAFADSGLLIGVAYAVMQIGRSAFAIWALRGQQLAANYQRILAWCCVSGALAIAGGLTASAFPRALFWLLAVGVDLLGGMAGFYTPWLGRSTTREWDIEGGHFAERCQGFILIALGESIVVIGGTLTGLLGPGGPLSTPHADRAVGHDDRRKADLRQRWQRPDIFAGQHRDLGLQVEPSQCVLHCGLLRGVQLGHRPPPWFCLDHVRTTGLLVSTVIRRLYRLDSPVRGQGSVTGSVSPQRPPQRTRSAGRAGWVDGRRYAHAHRPD